MIRINDKPYDFKYKIEDITLNDYLTMIDILGEDEYPTYIDKNGKEHNKKEPLPKNERSDKFMMDLYRKIIKYLSTIPLKYLKEDEVIITMIGKLNPIFDLANEIMSKIYDEIEEFGIDNLRFDNIDDYRWTQPETWTFNKWVTFEMLYKGEYQKLEDGSTKLLVAGNRSILPIFLGLWWDDFRTYKNKFELFNNKLSFSVTYSNYLRILATINDIKSKHPFIYNNEGSSSAGNPHSQKHSQDFGWLDIMGRLADKGVFGTYLDLKKAPLLDVLEYLNCSTSRDSAEYEDSKIKH